jgi:predicted permease
MNRLDHFFVRLALRCYPREFRRDRAAELQAIYAHCLEVERARRSRLAARVAAFADALRAAWQLRSTAAPSSRRPAAALAGLGQDLRVAGRGLRRAPVFFAGVTLVLALGVGANGAIFSLVQAVLLEPLPYHEPDRLVRLWAAYRGRDQLRRGTVPHALVRWREGSAGVLDGVAGIKSWEGSNDAMFDLVTPDGAERVRGALVTSNFFEVLGTIPALGRTFGQADEDAGHTNLIVLGHGLWQRAFGGDPGVVGRTVSFIAGRRDRGPKPYVVVGVMPPAFTFTYPVATEFWTVFPRAGLADDGSIQFNGAVARLAPGVTVADASRHMEAVAPRPSRPSTPAADRVSTSLEPMREWVVSESRPAMLLLSGVAALLLVIACATVASALLVRLAERQRELAVRASLGAARRRLVGQLLVEGLVLSLAGTAAGIAIAAALLPALRSLVPPLVPRGNEVAIDGSIIGFAAGAAALVTVLSALLPALLGSRIDLVTAVRRASGTASPGAAATRWRAALVGVQAAVATCLLAGALLLVVSFRQLGRVDLGYDGRDVVTVEMRLLDPKYFRGATEDHDAPAIAQFQRDLMTRVRAIPGVLEAGMTTAVPFRGIDFLYGGISRGPGEATTAANRRAVDAGYFSVMRVPLLAGRLFGPQDTPTSPPVAVLSASLARTLFGDANPIGETIEVDGAVEVVGVVADLRYAGIDREASPAMYVPRAQNASELICLVVRTSPGVEVGAAIRRAVQELDPTLPAMNLTTIDRIVSESVADRRFYTTTTSVFSALALLLTATGLGVVVARAIVERRREMAIRLSLGASFARLVRDVTWRGLGPVAAGVVAGLMVAWLSARVLEPFLFDVDMRDARIYGVSALLTIGVGAAACLMPARRLARLAPAPLLRSE